MGCFDVYCALCGVRLNGGMIRDISKEPKKPQTISTTRWMERCTVLVPHKKPQHGFLETACNCTFERKGQSYFLCYAKKKNKFVPMEGAGLAVHTDCWRAARKATGGKALTFEHFDMNKLRLQYKGAHNYTLTHLKYSPADTYNKTQHFANDDIENIKESDRYILFSPLGASAASKRNAARVAGNARRLLLQRGRRATANSRPSPSEKAREFKNQKRKGNNGGMWRSKKGANGVYRWVPA